MQSEQHVNGHKFSEGGSRVIDVKKRSKNNKKRLKTLKNVTNKKNVCKRDKKRQDYLFLV